MGVESTAALVLVVLLHLLLLFLLVVCLCLLKLVLLRGRRWLLWLLLLRLLARKAVRGPTAARKLKPRGGRGMPEGCHVGGGGGQCWPHLARGGGMTLGMRRVDVLGG